MSMQIYVLYAKMNCVHNWVLLITFSFVDQNNYLQVKKKQLSHAFRFAKTHGKTCAQP